MDTSTNETTEATTAEPRTVVDPADAWERAGWTVELCAEPEDTDPASELEFPEDVEWVRDQLDAGNEWSWCVAHVRVTHPDAPGLVGEAYLGGCMYHNEADFRGPSGADYFGAMISDAAADVVREAEHAARLWGADTSPRLARLRAARDAAERGDDVSAPDPDDDDPDGGGDGDDVPDPGPVPPAPTPAQWAAAQTSDDGRAVVASALGATGRAATNVADDGTRGVIRCAECKSLDVQLVEWTNPNTGEVIPDGFVDDLVSAGAHGMTFCTACDDDGRDPNPALEWVELPAPPRPSGASGATGRADTDPRALLISLGWSDDHTGGGCRAAVLGGPPGTRWADWAAVAAGDVGADLPGPDDSAVSVELVDASGGPGEPVSATVVVPWAAFVARTAAQWFAVLADLSGIGAGDAATADAASTVRP